MNKIPKIEAPGVRFAHGTSPYQEKTHSRRVSKTTKQGHILDGESNDRSRLVVPLFWAWVEQLKLCLILVHLVSLLPNIVRSQNSESRTLKSSSQVFWLRPQWSTGEAFKEVAFSLKKMLQSPSFARLQEALLRILLSLTLANSSARVLGLLENKNRVFALQMLFTNSCFPLKWWQSKLSWRATTILGKKHGTCCAGKC